VSGARSLADDPSTCLPWLDTTVEGSRTGAIGGLQASYNWQIANVVLGIEGDISVAWLNSSVSGLGLTAEGTYSAKLKALGTVRGRVGWAFDRLLVYGTGGAAFASLKDEYSDTFLGATLAPSSRVTGWTAVGGFEYAFADHWTAKVEYLHVGFPERTVLDTASGYAFAFKDKVDIGRVGIHYKF
jgi:outer membrane immunogenic protein